MIIPVVTGTAHIMQTTRRQDFYSGAMIAGASFKDSSSMATLILIDLSCTHIERPPTLCSVGEFRIRNLQLESCSG
jgi:hypothetical protein